MSDLNKDQIRRDHAAIAAHNEGQLGMPQGPCQCAICVEGRASNAAVPPSNPAGPAASHQPAEAAREAAESYRLAVNLRMRWDHDSSLQSMLEETIQRAITAATAAQQAEIAALREENRRLSGEGFLGQFARELSKCRASLVTTKDERDALRAELATTRERLAKCEGVIREIWLEAEGYVDGAPDAGEMAGLANRIVCEIYKVLSHESLAAQPLDGGAK